MYLQEKIRKEEKSMEKIELLGGENSHVGEEELGRKRLVF
jgi:hypothetical protein